MQIIGITGGIGSGKSTICRELAQRGYSVYDCDLEAKRLIAEDGTVRAAITGLLGREAFEGARYNTAYVAKRVFADPALLAQLNAIVHPAVRQDILRLKPEVIESALLYEAGLDALCDTVVVVEAPEDIRIARTIARDYGNDASEENINKVRARIQAQVNTSPAPDNKKRLTILNDGQTPISELVQSILTNS